MSQTSPRDNLRPRARQRVTQACKTCRQRKVRCDAGIPRCGLCARLQIECVYLEPENDRIDSNTRILLNRIQQLEDRMFPHSSDSSAAPTTPNVESLLGRTRVGKTSNRPDHQYEIDHTPQGNSMTLPVTHSANSDNVYQWETVQSLLTEYERYHDGSHMNGRNPSSDATDIFLSAEPLEVAQSYPGNWAIFSDVEHCFLPIANGGNLAQSTVHFSLILDSFKVLIEEYFVNFHTFYPLLKKSDLSQSLELVANSELYRTKLSNDFSLGRYCQLIMVLCIGSACQSLSQHNTSGPRVEDGLETTLWMKCQLLLGVVSLENTVTAAQCITLSSIYLGLKGRPIDSHQQIHLAARKVSILAKRSILENRHAPDYSGEFCRLYWIVYVLESDYATELFFTPPSGITAFEDLVPYPSSERFTQEQRQDAPIDFARSRSSADVGGRPNEGGSSHNLSAFQISTNSAIRRFMNRITAAIYNPQEAWRKQNTGAYVNRLLTITNELQNHHEAIHSGLPSFMLSTDESVFWRNEKVSVTALPDPRKFTNHLWNVRRLRGRYFAGQYLICRASFELILLNQHVLENHPNGSEILQNCGDCLNSCASFIRVFDTEAIVPTTNLFATGMATFAMVTILMICTTSAVFLPVQPPDIEDVINVGLMNLKRFSRTVKQFAWHIEQLQRLDAARKGTTNHMST